MRVLKIRGFNIKRYKVLFTANPSRVISFVNTKYNDFSTKSQAVA